MRISCKTGHLLLVGAFVVACGQEPTALDQGESPQLKRVKAPDCELSPTATSTIAGTVRWYGRVTTVCAQKVGDEVTGTWTASPDYGGVVLDLVPPNPTAEDPVGFWCLQKDYSATTAEGDLSDKNVIMWIRDVGNGSKNSYDEIATRRVDAAGASCATETPPPIPPEECTQDPDVIGIECFTPVKKGDFVGTVN
jgi:hypothetical protein